MKLLVLLLALASSYRTNEIIRSEEFQNPAWIKTEAKVCQIVHVEPGTYTLSIFTNSETKLSMRTHDRWLSWPETTRVSSAKVPFRWVRQYTSMWIPNTSNLEVCLEGISEGMWGVQLELSRSPTEYIPTKYCPVTENIP